MSDFVTIVRVETEGTARVLAMALRAHGFNPRELADGGLPGIRAVLGRPGFPIEVPASEAEDATPLALDLLKDMVD